MTLVELLQARLDEAEQAARSATPGPWKADDPTWAETIYGPDHVAVVAGGRWGGEASVFESTDDALHIARYHPARVLAEVEAKRRIVDLCAEALAFEGPHRYSPSCADLAEDILRAQALPYADHPDYDPTWRA